MSRAVVATPQPVQAIAPVNVRTQNSLPVVVKNTKDFTPAEHTDAWAITAAITSIVALVGIWRQMHLGKRALQKATETLHATNKALAAEQLGLAQVNKSLEYAQEQSIYVREQMRHPKLNLTIVPRNVTALENRLIQLSINNSGERTAHNIRVKVYVPKALSPQDSGGAEKVMYKWHIATLFPTDGEVLIIEDLHNRPGKHHFVAQIHDDWGVYPSATRFFEAAVTISPDGKTADVVNSSPQP